MDHSPDDTEELCCLQGKLLSKGDDHFFEKFIKIPFARSKRGGSIKGEHHSLQGIDLELQYAIRPTVINLTSEETDKLYEEALYTIKHKIGQTAGGHSHVVQDLYRYSQEAFLISPRDHARLLAKAIESKPPIVILNVTIVDAKNLEAKDADGFSDPFCILGIVPGSRLSESPGAVLAGSTAAGEGQPGSVFWLENGGGDSHRALPTRTASGKDKSPHPLRKFGQSLRRKVGGSEKSRLSPGTVDRSFKENIPAKYLQTTSVKENTLKPIWNEKFRFDLEDVSDDKLHLDIWDHDDETNVFDAVGRLNEVKGVRGLSRYFKQVGQSARSSSNTDVDDFLGCITVQLNNIPSTGLDTWFKLEGRTARSKVQGEIHLKMSLATREDRGISEEDNWTDVRQHESLIRCFVRFESRKHQPTNEWSGKLPEPGETILHQHAIQGDITSVQLAMCRWIAYSRSHHEYGLSYDVLSHLLERIDTLWQPGSLSRGELEFIGESFANFMEYSLHLVQRVRDAFPAEKEQSCRRLKGMLRCVDLIQAMEVYRYSCPFARDTHSELVNAVQKAADDHYSKILTSFKMSTKCDDTSLMNTCSIVRELNWDLYLCEKYYNELFHDTVKLSFFYVTYRRYDKLIKKYIFDTGHLSKLKVKYDANEEDFACSEYLDFFLEAFQLFIALQEFYRFRESMSSGDLSNLQIADCHIWFRPVLDTWIPFAKHKLLHRIDVSVEMDKVNQVVSNSSCTSSALETATCLATIVDVWRRLHWPDLSGRLPYMTMLTQVLSECALFYADNLYEKLRLAGFYDEKGQFDIAEQLCLGLNNIDYVLTALGQLPTSLAFERIAEEVGRTSGEDEAGQLVLRSLVHLHTDGCDTVLATLQTIVDRVAAKMRPEIRKNVFHLCWSPDSVPVEQALGDLLTYLDSNLATLKRHLLRSTFLRLLQAIWTECLDQFLEQSNKEMEERAEAGVGACVQSEVIFPRLHASLEILYQFFNANEKGLAKEQLESEQYKKVKYLLELQKSSTQDVVVCYFEEKLAQQESLKDSSNGQLSVRVCYKRESSVLSVEVISAKSLTPLDSNGLSDPFVIVELAPPHFFNIRNKTAKTKVVKNCLDPQFNEQFEFPVTLDQLKQPGATLCFVVMDHDMLMTDDYEGGVFLPLGNISGVRSAITGYTALKTLTYSLLLPKYSDDGALSVLKQRSNDSYAQDIVKRWLQLELQALDQAT